MDDLHPAVDNGPGHLPAAVGSGAQLSGNLLVIREGGLSFVPILRELM